MAETVTIKVCRLCESAKLEPLLSLGDQYVPDFITSEGESPQAPLELVRCINCGLIQLRHTFSRRSLYRHYWYKSGISDTMRKALSEITNRAREIADPHTGDLVVDIGCNDGTLLRSYGPGGLTLVGFELASNLVPEANKGTSFVFNDFFSADAFVNRFGKQKARIVTCVAMFYDLENPNSFTNDVARILASDGIWVVQQNYVATMIKQNGYDNIGHEHLEYYSLGTMEKLVEKHGLEVFDAETNDVNGGSFRTFICHRGARSVHERVKRMEKDEIAMGLNERSTYERFARSIEALRAKLYEFVSREVKEGRKVYVYGASNRGNTILQYCGLDHRLIPKAADANPEKWGRNTAGTLIPIVSKEEARRDRPDYFLILPHHFLQEILREERDYMKSGGRLIVPLPEFRVLHR